MFNLELLIRVVIAALASYRVARMLATETGPFAWFSEFRGWVDLHTNSKWVMDGVTCPLCIGWYASAVMLGMTYLDYVNVLVLWQAVAGLQVAITKQERPELPKVFMVKVLPRDKPKQER